MKRVRFAPSPTGSLHVGNALSAVANHALGDWMLLRIDDTDPARNVPGGEQAILRDLEWLGVGWDEGPVRQSERQARYREAVEPLGARFEGTTLLREDGTATYQLASVVDDIDFGITHVVRGNDHRPNEPLHRRLHEALGTTPPEYVHHGLILGPDGKKMSKRAEGATVASLRDAGIPPEAMRRYLDQLGLPRHDVRYDLPRIRRYSIETIAALPDEELAARVGVPVGAVAVLRGGAGPDPHVLLRADRVRARAHRQRAPVRARHVAAALARRARLRRNPRPQHHRHQRQDLRRGPRRERRARRVGDRVVSAGHARL